MSEIRTRNYNKIFGIGLSKTGTTSLGLALNQIGVPTIDFPHDPVTLRQLEAADYRLKVLDKYDAVTDTPVVPYYPQLDALYPGSKFILTVRDMDAWLKSIRAHFGDRDACDAWVEIDQTQRDFAYFINIAVYGSIEFNEPRFRYVYERHVRDVKAYFADRPDDLLILDICGGQSMGPLGSFLGINVDDKPFPRANTQGGRREWIDYLVRLYNTLDEKLPADAVVAWADECELLGLKPRKVRKEVTFPEHDGVYQGRPVNDEQARQYLEDARVKGAQFLVFVKDTLWWLDHYHALRQQLTDRHRCLIDSPEFKVFDIRATVGAAKEPA